MILMLLLVFSTRCFLQVSIMIHTDTLEILLKLYPDKVTIMRFTLVVQSNVSSCNPSQISNLSGSYNKWGLRNITHVQNFNIICGSRDMESQSWKFHALTWTMPILAPEAHIEKLNMIYIPQPSLIITTWKIWNWFRISRGDTFQWMTNAKCIVVTFSQDKLLPIPLKCLKVVFLKSLWKDDSSDILFVYPAFVVLLLWKKCPKVWQRPESNLTPPSPLKWPEVLDPLLSHYGKSLIIRFPLFSLTSCLCTWGEVRHLYPKPLVERGTQCYCYKCKEA